MSKGRDINDRNKTKFNWVDDEKRPFICACCQEEKLYMFKKHTHTNFDLCVVCFNRCRMNHECKGC